MSRSKTNGLRFLEKQQRSGALLEPKRKRPEEKSWLWGSATERKPAPLGSGQRPLPDHKGSQRGRKNLVLLRMLLLIVAILSCSALALIYWHPQ